MNCQEFFGSQESREPHRRVAGETLLRAEDEFFFLLPFHLSLVKEEVVEDGHWRTCISRKRGFSFLSLCPPRLLPADLFQVKERGETAGEMRAALALFL